MNGVKALLLFAWDLLVPRFITEDVALTHISGPLGDFDSYEISCSLADVRPGELFDCISTVDAFQFLGIGVTYRFGNFRPFKNPHEVEHGC